MLIFLDVMYILQDVIYILPNASIFCQFVFRNTRRILRITLTMNARYAQHLCRHVTSDVGTRVLCVARKALMQY